jgi:hypothetical protein
MGTDGQDMHSRFHTLGWKELSDGKPPGDGGTAAGVENSNNEFGDESGDAKNSENESVGSTGVRHCSNNEFGDANKDGYEAANDAHPGDDANKEENESVEITGVWHNDSQPPIKNDGGDDDDSIECFDMNERFSGVCDDVSEKKRRRPRGQ